MLCAMPLFFGGHGAQAKDPVGDFFKKIGNSIAPQRPRKERPPVKARSTKTRPGKGPDVRATAVNRSPNETPLGPIAASPAPITVRPATRAPQTNGHRRDVPYGLPVPNKPGFVTSPYAPTSGMVDTRGFPSGTEVKDPYTDKIFLTP